MDPFADLLSGLQAAPEDPTARDARLDPGRERRKGVPEVIYAPGKSPDLVERLTGELLERTGRAIVSRPAPELRASLERLYSGTHQLSGSWCLGLQDPAHPRTPTGGRVGVVSAGSSDIPVAEEAQIVAGQMGCAVRVVYDVGVAGLHRLLDRREVLAGARAVVVCAGMEGALASVGGGLVACPVVAVATRVGYGAAFGGVAALLTMLNSCATGVAVVNIDNGFGAGYFAHLVAHQGEK